MFYLLSNVFLVSTGGSNFATPLPPDLPAKRTLAGEFKEALVKVKNVGLENMQNELAAAAREDNREKRKKKETKEPAEASL